MVAGSSCLSLQHNLKSRRDEGMMVSRRDEGMTVNRRIEEAERFVKMIPKDMLAFFMFTYSGFLYGFCTS